MIWLLGGIFIAVTLTFIGLWFVAVWIYELLRDRYQAQRKHVLHTTAADERIVTAERKSMAKLRELPAPGLDIYTDRNVWLPPTPRAEPGPPIVAAITDVPARRPAPADELESTFVRALLAAVPDPDHIDAVFAGRR